MGTQEPLRLASFARRQSRQIFSHLPCPRAVADHTQCGRLSGLAIRVVAVISYGGCLTWASDVSGRNSREAWGEKHGDSFFGALNFLSLSR